MTNFNPKDHMIKLQGKDYLLVADRILWFRTANQTGSIQTDLIQFDSTIAVVKATVIIDGMIVATGYAACLATAGKMGRYLEKAETGAIGRALGIAGYGTQFSGDELDEGDQLSDAPREPKAAPASKRPYSPQALQTMITAGVAARNNTEPINEDAARKLAIKWGNILKGVADKPALRHEVVSVMLGATIASFNELTQAEADTLDAWLTKDAPMCREEAAYVIQFLTAQSNANAAGK